MREAGPRSERGIGVKNHVKIILRSREPAPYFKADGKSPRICHVAIFLTILSGSLLSGSDPPFSAPYAKAHLNIMDSSEHMAYILDKRCREAGIGTGWEPKTGVPGQSRLQLEGRFAATQQGAEPGCVCCRLRT